MAESVGKSGDELGDFDGLWDYSRAEVTEGRFREVLAAAGGRGDRGRVMELKTQIARCLGEFDGYIGAEYGQCLAAVGRVGEARGILVEAYGVLSKDSYMIEYESEELGRIRELAGIQG